MGQAEITIFFTLATAPNDFLAFRFLFSLWLEEKLDFPLFSIRNKIFFVFSRSRLYWQPKFGLIFHSFLSLLATICGLFSTFHCDFRLFTRASGRMTKGINLICTFATLTGPTLGTTEKFCEYFSCDLSSSLDDVRMLNGATDGVKSFQCSGCFFVQPCQRTRRRDRNIAETLQSSRLRLVVVS